MNSLVNEFIYFKMKKNKNPAWELNHTNCGYILCHTTINLLSTNVFTISILILYMIVMSEKMMSQTITDEFIYVSV